METTDEFSFVLKPSAHGIGVFAAHNIKKDTYLRLFGDEKTLGHSTRLLPKDKVPEFFHTYCMDKGEDLVAPTDFGAMPVGWYLNHSSQPNATHREYHWYAYRDIKAGEEILIDYNSLQEPEEAKESYYS